MIKKLVINNHKQKKFCFRFYFILFYFTLCFFSSFWYYLTTKKKTKIQKKGWPILSVKKKLKFSWEKVERERIKFLSLKMVLKIILKMKNFYFGFISVCLFVWKILHFISMYSDDDDDDAMRKKKSSLYSLGIFTFFFV